MTKPALQELDAETQIFTPPYVAKYLAQNSIGRLWAHSKPTSSITDNFGWYVTSTNPPNLAKVASPEEIRVLDPACGTGNLLVAAFDVLYDIYKDAGYKEAGIPARILTHNLYGYDIDVQAVEAAKAILTAKAHEKNTHFFRYGVTPNIRVLTRADYTESHAADLFGDTSELPDPGLFGTLIRDLDTSKYHVVIANPPYMGSKHFTKTMSAFAKANYPDSARDLGAMFHQRGLEMLVPGGMIAYINMQSWMFLSSFQKMREEMLDSTHIVTMAHLGNGVFGPGAVISTTAWVQTNLRADIPGVYFRLVDSKSKQRDLQLQILTHRGEPSPDFQKGLVA